MNRREFVKTSAGFLAAAIAPGVWFCGGPESDRKNIEFRPYRSGKTLCPVTCVTPDDGYYIHSFYDVCPFSPSQRYLAVTRIPFQDHDPVFGETADVCVIDLENHTIETVYTTRGWGFQLGANLNWGKTDRYLYTNDSINGEAVCVRIDLKTHRSIAMSGPMYHIAPDESCVIGFPLDIINVTQRGYGVPEDPENPPRMPSGASESQGLWKTDLRTNERTLLVSLKDVADKVPIKSYYKGGTFYFFHSKFNRDNTRIMQVLRCLFPDGKGKWNPQLFTFNTDGTDIKQAVTREQWAPGGHHPNWHPDGEHLIMNLKPDGKTLRFCRFRYDGSDFRVLSEKLPGSGHPSVEPSDRYLVTDSYPNEPVALDNEEVPIRLVDIKDDDEENICTIYTLGSGKSTLRCDPHPAWSRDYKRVCFNGTPDGARQVFIADLSTVM